MVKPLLSLFVCFYSFVADFGELSKKLAEVWKQLPEKDKLVSTIYYGHVFHCFMPFKVYNSPIDHPKQP